MATEGSTRAVVTAMFANLGIAVTKFVAFLLTQSSSMLAESVHSLADTSNQALLLLGGKRAKRAATPEHPFGYGRERYVYGFVVSIVLFSLGGLFALHEAWHKWADPHPIDTWQWVPIAVLLVAMAMEGYALRTAVIESNRVRGRRSWARFIRTAKAPELPVILLEDLGALLGLVFALLGVSMTLITGEGRWDAAGTAMIGLLLVAIAAILAVEMKSLLIGESASREYRTAIENALPGDGVDSVIHLRTLHLGPEELLVAAKIAISAASTGADVAQAIDAAEKRVRAAVPIARVIYLEPDLRRTDNLPATP
ncbi:cation diffusion facilitator family transporter [Amycolatopsis keratiniphila]|uniref:cation diffusion facilitator family transporter n=1 Tax=Amycolatopsis keratiniphila TaxID=129921 RepID=UPI00087BD8E6|nr:cation diffusion facilitator family transporter [Amycolatopsis keratiniphila]OLZ60717.1 cation transporter [Amycolatopsis keratiniphila subsp. nogabecina]SDU66125.1 cation diffusion facilitator family transporter [Amycolatopsis keratiniphila]